jgi:hypothetical protein
LGDRDTNEYPPTNFILELAEYVLTYNYFRFDDDISLKQAIGYMCATKSEQ